MLVRVVAMLTRLIGGASRSLVSAPAGIWEKEPLDLNDLCRLCSYKSLEISDQRIYVG
jgi:hypothetical protein